MITAGELLSRNIRANFLDNFDPPNMLAVVEEAKNKNTRIIPDVSNFVQEASQEENGIVGTVLKWVTNVAKWSYKAIKWLGLSAIEAWNWVVATWEAIWRFDWNSSDAELKTIIDNYNVQIASIWGGVVGQFAIGYLGAVVFAAGIGLVVPVIGGPLLAKALVGVVTAELLPELIDNLGAAITATLNLEVTKFTIAAYMGVRRLIKKIPKNQLDSLVGEKASDWIRNVWGAPNAPTLSFSNSVETKIEDIDNKALQAFIEEALEEGYDTFIEGGSIVAQKLDEAIFMYEAAVQNAQGPDRSVVIYPDANSDEEFLILEDIPQSRAIEVTQTLINQHRLLGNRSVGNIVASSFDEPTVAKPLLRKLKIFFSSRPKPPWVEVTTEDGKVKPAKTVEVSIPDVKPGVTWNQVKKAAKEYTWGRFCGVVRFTNKRKMIVRGDSKATVEAKIEDFLDLTTATVQSITITEETDVPNKVKKMPTKIYPRKATLLHRKNSLDNDGNVVIDNKYFDTDYDEFLLWVDDEPPNMPKIT